MFHHARRLQKILLKPIFKNINSLFPRTKYRGMFVVVFGVTNTLRNIFIIYKMVSFILEDSIEKGLSTFNTHHKWQSPTTQYHTTIFKETKETERY